MSSRALAVSALLIVIAGLLIYAQNGTRAEPPTQPTKPAADNVAPTKPLPLAEKTRTALAYLANQQLEDGGWGQGGGWRQNTAGSGRVDGPQVKDPSDLGNTCFATLALLRSGSIPHQGEYATNVARGIAYICGKIEQSDSDSLYVTDVRDTQLQTKIGRYVDTFAAGLVLTEWKGMMPAATPDRRALAALEKVLRKIDKNQNADGTFTGNNGWASVLSQGLATKCLNRASQFGTAVRPEVLRRDYAQSLASRGGDARSIAAAPADARGGGGTGGRGIAAYLPSAVAGKPAPAAAPTDAGVQLYGLATTASRINDFGNTSAMQEKDAQETLRKRDATPAEKQTAQQVIDRTADVRKAQKDAIAGVVSQLSDKKFIAGFGNNGGEEFLSYMNIGEMLAAARGPQWDQWHRAITENLDRVQNRDGSWSGQHCITGRTFCTSAALLTLMADRAPVPAAAKLADNP